MDANELKQKRFDIITDLLDGVTHETGYALGPVSAALNAIDALDEERFAKLEAIITRKTETIEMLKRAAPPLTRLWVSSTDLLERFKAYPTTKQAVDRMMSEVAELIIAATDVYGASTVETAKEAVDVWVTVINVLRAASVSDAAFYEALEDVMASNDKKTTETHQRSAQNGVERLPVEKVQS